MGKLEVVIQSKHAGSLKQIPNGITFEYKMDYPESAVPLSLSMLDRNRIYGVNDSTIENFLWNILPDNEKFLNYLSDKYAITENNPLYYLEHIGLDCAGAVQFCTSEKLEETLNRAGTLQGPLSELEICDQIKKYKEAYRNDNIQDDFDSDIEDIPTSLGGFQTKIALRKKGSEWFEPKGSAATTHILKPGINSYSMPGQSATEYFALKMAKNIGINSAECSLLHFGDEEVVCSARYDRIIKEEKVIRVHQEDLAQALGLNSRGNGKYVFDTAKIMTNPNLLQNVDNLKEDFTTLFFYNYLIGNADAHIKNYSIILLPDGRNIIAPLYDSACFLGYYTSYGKKLQKSKAAMKIGGEDRFGHIKRQNILDYANEFDLDEKNTINNFVELAAKIIENTDSLVNDICKISSKFESIADKLVTSLNANCKNSIEAVANDNYIYAPNREIEFIK